MWMKIGLMCIGLSGVVFLLISFDYGKGGY